MSRRAREVDWMVIDPYSDWGIVRAKSPAHAVTLYRKKHRQSFPRRKYQTQFMPAGAVARRSGEEPRPA